MMQFSGGGVIRSSYPRRVLDQVNFLKRQAVENGEAFEAVVEPKSKRTAIYLTGDDALNFSLRQDNLSGFLPLTIKELQRRTKLATESEVQDKCTQAIEEKRDFAWRKGWHKGPLSEPLWDAEAHYQKAEQFVAEETGGKPGLPKGTSSYVGQQVFNGSQEPLVYINVPSTVYHTNEPLENGLAYTPITKRGQPRSPIVRRLMLYKSHESAAASRSIQQGGLVNPNQATAPA